jgi:hypothetical protein
MMHEPIDPRDGVEFVNVLSGEWMSAAFGEHEFGDMVITWLNDGPLFGWWETW